MKKTAKILALVLAIAMVVALLTACGSKSALVGTWNSKDAEGTSITVKDDGTGSMDAAGISMDFKYTEKDNKVVLSRDNEELKFNYEYTIEGDTLSLKDEDTDSTLTYTKK